MLDDVLSLLYSIIVNVLFEMIMVRNRMTTCDLSDAEVSDIIARVSYFV